MSAVVAPGRGIKVDAWIYERRFYYLLCRGGRPRFKMEVWDRRCWREQRRYFSCYDVGGSYGLTSFPLRSSYLKPLAAITQSVNNLSLLLLAKKEKYMTLDISEHVIRYLLALWCHSHYYLFDISLFTNLKKVNYGPIKQCITWTKVILVINNCISALLVFTRFASSSITDFGRVKIGICFLFM